MLNMTQNNERELINKLALECGLLLKTTNLDLCHSYLTKLEAFAKAYAISQKEKQEVVAYADASLVCTISTYMIKELESRNETNKFPYHLWTTKLYTSPPKQIPDGWKLVPIDITEDMHVAAVKAIQKCTGNDDFPRTVYKAMLNAAPTASLTSETNTEVGE